MGRASQWFETIVVTALLGLGANAVACGDSTSGLARGPAGHSGQDGGLPDGSSGQGGAGDGGSASGGRSPSGGGGAGGASAGGGAANGGSTSTGGRSAGGASDGGPGTGGTANVTRCVNSLDCRNDPLGRLICATNVGVCVECVQTADCDPNNDCVGNRCVPFTPCSNSRDCPLDQVCDSAAGKCFPCVANADCGTGQVCAGHACRTFCDSDRDCTPLGLLCDFASSACVSCLSDDQCPATSFCSAGSCVADVCPAGATLCQGNSVVGCSARGDAWNQPAPCSARQACVSSSSGAACKDWVCTPGKTECSGPRTVVNCSSDGLSVLSTVDCAQTNQYCSSGACSAQVCAPNTNYCEQGAVRRCAADGLSSTVVTTCTANEYCDTVAAACKAMVCTKGQPACDGNRATVCNADGSGYEAGGTDCTTQSRTCVAGACQTCPVGGSPRSVRLIEVFTGQADYVRLKNTSATCPADLSGLTLSVQDTDTTTIANLTIPSYSLAPGAVALVSESGTTGDVLTSGLIDLNSTAGYVMLCVGPCSTSGTVTVIDALSYWNGTTAPPAFPSPVTFSPIQGIASSPSTTAFVRSAFTGTYPAFAASDWSVGPATRPETGTGTCPATQPSSICTSFGLVCTYGAVTCTCGITALWSCV